MRQEFKLQDPGEGVREVEINEVLVSKGDEVSEGDSVLVVESDKAAIELPSPYSGRIAEIKVSEGDTAEVGDVLMVIDTEAEGAEPEGEPAEEWQAEKGEEEEGEKDAAEEEEAGAEEAEEEPAKDGEDKRRRAAAEAEEEVEDEEAEDEEAEDEEAEDEEAEAEAEKQEKEEAAAKRKRPEKEAEEKAAEEEEGPIKAAPAARKLAKEEGVDLASVEPTGSKGQITLDDVRAAVGEPAEKPEGEKPEGEKAPAEAGEERDEFGPVERVKLRSIRAATARAMARSWAEIPHVTHEDLADITELERWRRDQVKAEGDETLTLTPFIVKAAAAILRRHPRFNARLDQDSGEIVLRQYYNVNVAVATERGLITPVLREVDRKPVRALAHELAELTERMHEGEVSKQDLQGGTFTVTNVGGLGGTSFAPIINPPQTAILGCARARLMSVVDGDLEHLDSARTETRLMLPLIVAFDHRVLDGADAARFVNQLKALLEDVKAFALDV